MPRIKLSEFKSKNMLSPYLDLDYKGIRLTDNSDPEKVKMASNKKYVVKVDEGIKKRQKNGLIVKNINKPGIISFINKTVKLGYKNFLVEEFIPHKSEEEKFLALERTRDGTACYYSNQGGIDIEDKKENVRKDILTPDSLDKIANFLNIKAATLKKLSEAFDKFYISFLESNPFVVKGNKLHLLDLAVEADSCGEFFADGAWTKNDFVSTSKQTEEEKNVKSLAEKTSSSLKLDLINPNGSIFTIFSGGGASIVLADAVYNIGKGKMLANYAEYSGNPTEEETYIFARNIISLMLKSKAKDKKLVVAGGVANFTDVRETFKGIIKALDDRKLELKKQNIKIFVRRGGPNQEAGLKMIKDFLEGADLLGTVVGPEVILTDIINKYASN